MPLIQNPHRCKTDSIANPGSILFRVPLVWGGAMHLPAVQQKDFVNPSPRTASSCSSRTAHHLLLEQAQFRTNCDHLRFIFGSPKFRDQPSGIYGFIVRASEAWVFVRLRFRFEASFIWRHHRHLSLLEHSAARCKSVDLFDLAAR